MKIELKTRVTETGCIVPTQHKLNSDGYFRKRVNGQLIMYHRHVWLENGGTIPDGHEINHKCGNRACHNIEHLEVLDRTTHLVLTNRSRYADERVEPKKYWQETNCSAAELIRKFNLTHTAYRWVREWRKNGET